MKKILLILVFISSIAFSQIQVIYENGADKRFRENIDGNFIYYDNNDVLQNISMHDININDSITCSYSLLFSTMEFKRFSLSLFIVTNQKMYIEVKDKYFNNLKLSSCNPSKFDNEGNPLEYEYHFTKDFYNLSNIIKDLNNENIIFYINDKRYIADNVYKNNRKLKERIIELSIKAFYKFNPQYSNKEIEGILNVTEARKNL